MRLCCICDQFHNNTWSTLMGMPSDVNELKCHGTIEASEVTFYDILLGYSSELWIALTFFLGKLFKNFWALIKMLRNLEGLAWSFSQELPLLLHFLSLENPLFFVCTKASIHSFLSNLHLLLLTSYSLLTLHIFYCIPYFSYLFLSSWLLILVIMGLHLWSWPVNDNAAYHFSVETVIALSIFF